MLSSGAALSAAPHFIAYIGLGGNLGDVHTRLRQAREGMSQFPSTAVLASSPLYRTKPVDATGPDYINAVIALRTPLGPLELLSCLQALEIHHDRQRPYVNAPRTLDLDVLWHGGLQREADPLHLPHPRMLRRAFVLEPLWDVVQTLRCQPENLEGLFPVLMAENLPDAGRRAILAQEQGIERLDQPF